MLQLRIYTAADVTESVLELLDAEPAVSAVAVVRKGSIRPPGDLVMADVAREAANDVIDRSADSVFNGTGRSTSIRHRRGSRRAVSPLNARPLGAAPTQSCGQTSCNARTTTPS